MSVQNFLLTVLVLGVLLVDHHQWGVRAQQGTTMKATTARRQTPGRATGVVTQQRATTLPANNRPASTVPANGATAGRTASTIGGTGNTVRVAQSSSVATVNTRQTVRMGSTGTPTASVTTTTLAPPELPVEEWDLSYKLGNATPGLLTAENKPTCVRNQRNFLSSTFNIPTTRIAGASCNQFPGKPTEILVTAIITPGEHPTAEEIEQFKQRTSSERMYVYGPNNMLRPVKRGSFQYGERKTVASSSDYFLINGLTETHLVMIGMGTVILLLFIISITVICTERRATSSAKSGSRPEDEEASTSTELEPEEKPKKKRFGFLHRKKKDDVDKDSPTDDEKSNCSSIKEHYDKLDSDHESEKISDDDKGY